MADRELSRRGFLGVVASVAAGSISVPSAGAVESTPGRRGGKHFVLIHGAWHGAWCWYKIVAGLEEAGHRATALDLPSAGIDGTPPGTVTLQAQADRVIAFLDSLSEPVVLVGHSAGGAVISMVAETRPQKVEKLVYLTAFLLPDGLSQVSVAARDAQSLITRHLVFHPRRPFAADARSGGQTTNSRLHALGIQLLASNVRLHEQPRGVGVGHRHMLPTAQPTVTARAFVEAVGKGECLVLPRQQRNPIANRANQYRRVREPRQVEIPGEVLGELLDGDMIPAP